MVFPTELFSRPRSRRQMPAGVAFLLREGERIVERGDAGARPADFPRLAREMALRGRLT